MTRCWPRVVVAMCCCLLAVATAAHAESWMLWQQATVFTERWWVPKGWSSHWRATELTPVGLSEFRTLADCQLAHVCHSAGDQPASSREGCGSEPEAVGVRVDASTRHVGLRRVRVGVVE
jgi:hypothetical protein